MTRGRHSRPGGPLPWRLLLELSLGLAVILMGILLLSRHKTTVPEPDATPAAPVETAAPTAAPAPTPEPTPEPSPEPDAGELTLRLHGAEETVTLHLAPGELFAPPEEPLEGYTFLRWENSRGERLPSQAAPVWKSGDYYPVYAMRLGRKDHAPYLSLDEHGAFFPGRPLTRREAVEALYFLLDTELVGDGVFLDLPEDDPLFPAAATLKTLGILSGSRLHPEETITRQEFLEMLCRFFPEGTTRVLFSDLTEQDLLYPLFRTAAERGWIESGKDVPARPDEELTRLEFVSILNAAMDRHGDREGRVRMAGTILDVRQDDPSFWDVAEATIRHIPEGDGVEERWVFSRALPAREEGLFFLGVELHAIGAEGNPVVNGEYAGLRFDEDGIETSGDPELDRLVRELLAEVVDPAAMDGEKMLQELFEYSVLHFRYQPGNYYPPNEPSGWEAGEALSFFAEGKGNCYSFAAGYYELARAVGFPAKAYTGFVLGNEENRVDSYTDIYGQAVTSPPLHCPHGWVEIDFDGEPYIFDTEFAYRYYGKGKRFTVFFKLEESQRVRFGYTCSPWEPEADEDEP